MIPYFLAFVQDVCVTFALLPAAHFHLRAHLSGGCAAFFLLIITFVACARAWHRLCSCQQVPQLTFDWLLSCWLITQAAVDAEVLVALLLGRRAVLQVWQPPRIAPNLQSLIYQLVYGRAAHVKGLQQTPCCGQVVGQPAGRQETEFGVLEYQFNSIQFNGVSADHRLPCCSGFNTPIAGLVTRLPAAP